MARVLRALLASLALTACAPLPEPTVIPPEARSPFTGYHSAKYASPDLWLCRPDLDRGECRADLTATEIKSDGSRAVVAHAPAAQPKVDCFYVYPTVDMGILPANHTDFSNLSAIAGTTAAQAARFSEVCRLFVPLYRQVTIGTYLAREATREARLGVAFSDVADAFAHYLGTYNQGRKMVLIGHSQGAEMVVRLLRRFFEQDPALRERLLVALAIGGRFEVPRGQRAGGTLATIPLCEGPDEQGCVIAYRSYTAGSESSSSAWAPSPGHVSACVNPAGIGDGARRPFSRTYLMPEWKRFGVVAGMEGVGTPFVLYRDLYAGQCMEGEGGDRFLSVSELHGPGDRRQSPIDLRATLLTTGMGLHVLDFQFAQGDLIDQVGRRAASAR